MDWMRGYYAHSGYSYSYHAETMPARLRWAAMLHRHLLPATNFRYLDAGCGQGFNLILAAAMHPDSEFVGIDFMPDHIAHARRLADRCGLGNVTLIEGDFAELAGDPSALGTFDMAVCQGIASWIAPAIRQAAFAMIGRVLRPGGVFYNGYNCQPGWLSMMPFQHLARLHRQSGMNVDAIAAARRSLEQIGQASDALFGAFPKMPSRLQGLDGQDPAYLAQEYLHDSWQPFFVSDMIDELAAAKLTFLGSATLTDAFAGLLPPAVRELVEQQPSAALREQIRDFATLQNFRRDLYVKGKPAAWDVELAEVLRATSVMINPLKALPAKGEPFSIKGSTNELAGDHTAYMTLLEKIAGLGDEATIGKLIAEESDHRGKAGLIELLSIMIHGRWLTPRLEAPNPRGPQIAVAIAREVCLGAPYRHLPGPATGVALPVNETDLVMTKLVGEGVPREQLPAAVVAHLDKLQRQIARDGRAVTEPAEREKVLQELIGEFFANKLPYFRKAGAL
jgi:SAM-dependent methyltransferase